MFLTTFLLAMLPTAGPAQHATALAPTADGKLLFVAMNSGPGSKDGSGWVCVWDLSKPELKAVITGVPAAVRTIQPSADGKRFVLIGGDRWSVSHLEVWDTATKKVLHPFDVSGKPTGLTAVSPDGNWLAYRPITEKIEVWVWNTDTGKRAKDVEKAIGKQEGVIAFSADSRRLVVTSMQEYAEFDLAEAKKAGGWKRTEQPERVYHEAGGSVTILPNGKGVVTVAPTAKRRQSYVVRIATEKKDWVLGEFWDYASAPVVSPDGRLLIVTAGHRSDGGGTFVLKLDADGNPELETPPEKPVGPSIRLYDKKAPAWRVWTLGEANRAGREMPEPLAFTPDGKRLFVGGSLGKLQVYDPDKREPNATLFVATPKKDELPDWYILTAAGAFVGSPGEEESLAKGGKMKDAVKVRDALGVK